MIHIFEFTSYARFLSIVGVLHVHVQKYCGVAGVLYVHPRKQWSSVWGTVSFQVGPEQSVFAFLFF